MIKRIFCLSALLCCLISNSLFAQSIEPFTISDIQVEGAGRIEDGTIFNYLPLKVGDQINASDAREGIKALFDTGFFRNVKLRQDGTVLVVEVEERPSIAGVTISGAKAVKESDILEIFGNAELTQGRILNQKRLNEVVKAISDTYFARGRYSAKVEQDISMLDQNRARILLNINEGRVATISRITFVGNKTFSAKQLKKRMEMTEKRGLSPFNRKDLYSKQKFEGDIETLRSFYADRGFFEFDVRSTNVTISPNKQDIELFISIAEGDRFGLGELKVEGEHDIADTTLDSLLKVTDTSVFSRKTISEIRRAISDELANLGYGLAQVDTLPSVDNTDKQVDVTFRVSQGARLYVRRIDISGNTVSRDDVIRREMRQLEGARFSAADVKRSQERLQRLGYFDNVRIDTVPVPGVPDQVDLLVSINERSTGSLTFALGYSDAEGALFQIGYNQRNFLGLGRQLNVTLDNSDASQTYELSYTNPYYTVGGVSRGLYARSREINSSEISTAEYIANSIELGATYKFPVSETNSFNFTGFTEQISLEETAETPPEFQRFIADNPESTNFGARLSYSKNTLNDFIFPSAGSSASISLEAALPGSDVEYYKLNLSVSKYVPLGYRGLSFKSKIKIGYGGSYGSEGGDSLPFYKNYFAGGPTTVRGYRARSLGPQDSGTTPQPTGGDRRIVGSLELLLPRFGSGASKDKRYGAFIDAGMVYGEGEDVDFGEIRYSAGLVMQWYSPVGPLSLNYGVPLNAEDTDEEQKFQISLGTLFR